jgi:hypothetical protein
LCARKGAKYALVDGDKKFTLDGNQDDLAKLAISAGAILGHITPRERGAAAEEN